MPSGPSWELHDGRSSATSAWKGAFRVSPPVLKTSGAGHLVTRRTFYHLISLTVCVPGPKLSSVDTHGDSPLQNSSGTLRSHTSSFSRPQSYSIFATPAFPLRNLCHIASTVDASPPLKPTLSAYALRQEAERLFRAAVFEGESA